LETKAVAQPTSDLSPKHQDIRIFSENIRSDDKTSEVAILVLVAKKF